MRARERASGRRCSVSSVACNDCVTGTLEQVACAVVAAAAGKLRKASTLLDIVIVSFVFYIKPLNLSHRNAINQIALTVTPNGRVRTISSSNTSDLNSNQKIRILLEYSNNLNEQLTTQSKGLNSILDTRTLTQSIEHQNHVVFDGTRLRFSHNNSNNKLKRTIFISIGISEPLNNQNNLYQTSKQTKSNE